MNEKLSALMDSELSSSEADRLIQALKSDDSLKQTWYLYHIVGDGLRKLPLLRADFTVDIAQRLAQEPTVLAPRPGLRKAVSPSRFAMPLAASVAAVSLLGVLTWQVVQVNREPSLPQLAVASAPVAQVASAASPAPAKTPARVMFSSAASNSYLLAHQEFSPSYAVEGFPAYARTLSEAQDSAQ